MSEETPLTFDEFTHVDQIPHYDNFACYFRLGDGTEIMRRQSYYVALAHIEPDLEQRLVTGISALPRLSSETLKPFERDMYQAYLFMRKLVSSDAELTITAPRPRPE